MFNMYSKTKKNYSIDIPNTDDKKSKTLEEILDDYGLKISEEDKRIFLGQTNANEEKKENLIQDNSNGNHTKL